MTLWAPATRPPSTRLPAPAPPAAPAVRPLFRWGIWKLRHDLPRLVSVAASADVMKSPFAALSLVAGGNNRTPGRGAVSSGETAVCSLGSELLGGGAWPSQGRRQRSWWSRCCCFSLQFPLATTHAYTHVQSHMCTQHEHTTHVHSQTCTQHTHVHTSHTCTHTHMCRHTHTHVQSQMYT